MDQWPAAEGDPLLTLAHVMAAFATLVLLLAEWLVSYVAASRAGQAAPPFPIVV